MQAGDIISYREMCNQENVEVLQRGMNYRLHPQYSLLLMSTRSNAPYDDEILDDGAILIYEGHDQPRMEGVDPKKVDQPMFSKSGKLTQNGLFYEAAQAYQLGESPPEIVRVYEKIKSGIWVYNGEFDLVEAWLEKSARDIFKFRLKLRSENSSGSSNSYITSKLDHTRVIPSSVKLEVWQRDKGQCVVCGSDTNLHFDHIIPYSKGGTSLNAKNIQILCLPCNLAKSDNIE